MSVYSVVTPIQVKQFFSHYPLGEVLHFSGIADGIDNTHYFVTTSEGEFILTLFESIGLDELSHVMALLNHLDNKQLPCPSPQADRQAQTLRPLQQKQAAVFRKFPGQAILNPAIAHCHEIGRYLGLLHQHTQDYHFPISSNHDLGWCIKAFKRIDGCLTATDRALIRDELCFQAANSLSGLPTGVIHGDLFRDNALFVDDKLSGLLDFYSSGTGVLLLDIAITANDWCHDDGVVNLEKLAALLAGYETVRRLQADEKRNWPNVLRIAALRFWLSRLVHHFHPRDGVITQQKDPWVFRKLLCQYRQE